MIFLQNRKEVTVDTNATKEFDDMQRLYLSDHTIHRKFTENLTLTKLAQNLYLSEKQVSRIIKKNYGKTLHQIIVDMRLNAAEDLLENTDLSLLQIAIEIGFYSATAFSKAFIKRHGISPKEFRNAHKKKTAL